MKMAVVLAFLLMIGLAHAQTAQAPTIDVSGTIATGGTFQTLTGLSLSRRSFEFVNLCNVSSACTATTDNCYLFFASSGTPNAAAVQITYHRTGS